MKEVTNDMDGLSPTTEHMEDKHAYRILIINDEFNNLDKDQRSVTSPQTEDGQKSGDEETGSTEA